MKMTWVVKLHVCINKISNKNIQRIANCVVFLCSLRSASFLHKNTPPLATADVGVRHKNMNKHSIQILLINLILFTFYGCSIPKSSHTLIPPVGIDKAEALEISKQCMQESSKLAHKPLTSKENKLIGNLETCRFHGGGRGRSISCDRKIMCFLNRNYQLLEYPITWLSKSKCELLEIYKNAGIEKERLEYHYCKENNRNQCGACKSL